jgi:nicotinate-nucleotide pyrophosphorylase (carboxylating)
MDAATLREAVRLRDAEAGGRRPELEASGGVALDTAREVAETGVDYISIGALTHSAPALDFSMLLEAA